MSGTPTTSYAQVSDTGAAGDGIGTATTTFTSASEASYCVVSRLVASSTGGPNQWYMAPDADSAGIDFYLNSGKFATGGGWINDPREVKATLDSTPVTTVAVSRKVRWYMFIAACTTALQRTLASSGQSSGIGSDSFALTAYDKNGVLYKSVPTSLLGGGNVVIHLK